jgi:hypothetical protein
MHSILSRTIFDCRVILILPERYCIDVDHASYPTRLANVQPAQQGHADHESHAGLWL